MRRIARPAARAPRAATRRRAAEQRDELAPLHSITSSARASSVGGTSRPSALAVLRLMTSSNLVGCMHRQVGRLLALEDAADIDAGLTIAVGDAGSVAHQAAGPANSRDGRSRAARGACQRDELIARALKKPVRADKERTGPLLDEASRRPRRCRVRCWPARTSVASPSARAAACNRCNHGLGIRIVRVDEQGDRRGAGTSSCSSSSRFAASSTCRKCTPVTLPPGRLRLATRPSCDRVAADQKTIGIVAVAALAASAAGEPPTATITAT